MTKQLILQGFESLVESLSIGLRYEKGDFAGGLCKIGNQDILIINPTLPIDMKINIMADELKRLNLEQIYIRPALREIIENKKVEDKKIWKNNN